MRFQVPKSVNTPTASSAQIHKISNTVKQRNNHFFLGK